MLKWFTLFAIAIFLWWRFQSWKERRRRLQLGLPPEEQGTRPINILAGVFIVFYGGYLIWFLLFGRAQGA